MVGSAVAKGVSAGFVALLTGFVWPTPDSPAADGPDTITTSSFSKHDCNWTSRRLMEDFDGCSKLAIRHYSDSDAKMDLASASFCAVEYGMDCVIGTEIGVQIPSAFVYSPSEGMRMIMAPTLLNQTTSAIRTKNIKVSNPSDAGENEVFVFSEEIHVEFLGAGTKLLHSEVLKGAPAYCVQFLRSIVPAECWERID